MYLVSNDGSIVLSAVLNSSIVHVGTLTPVGTVSVACGSTQIFTCRTPHPIGWNIAGLTGINIPGPFNARTEHQRDLNDRFSSNDTGDIQTGVSVITISGFSISDNGGIIQCVDIRDNSTRGMATISVGEWICGK